MLRKEEQIIVSTIAELLGLPIDFYKSESRKMDLVFGRYILCRQLRKRRYTYAQIGAIIGRDHSSVIHLLNKYKTPHYFVKLIKPIENEIDKRIKSQDNYWIEKSQSFVKEVFNDGVIRRDTMVLKLANFLKELNK